MIQLKSDSLYFFIVFRLDGVQNLVVGAANAAARISVDIVQRCSCGRFLPLFIDIRLVGVENPEAVVLVCVLVLRSLVYNPLVVG